MATPQRWSDVITGAMAGAILTFVGTAFVGNHIESLIREEAFNEGKNAGQIQAAENLLSATRILAQNAQYSLKTIRNDIFRKQSDTITSNDFARYVREEIEVIDDIPMNLGTMHRHIASGQIRIPLKGLATKYEKDKDETSYLWELQ
jgi:hypothetical protein